MAVRSRRGGRGNGLDAWPGYVDALSTLLMVIIFVLLVFVLAQAFLSVSLSGRDQALERATRQLADLTDRLALERDRSEELRRTAADLGRDLGTAAGARDALAGQLAAARQQAGQAAAERDALRAERDRAAARLADLGLEAHASAEQARGLQARLAEAEGLAEQIRALSALRDELEKQIQEKDMLLETEQARRTAAERELRQETRLGESARAQAALLTRQIDDLKAQLARLAAALDASDTAARDKDARIADLGQRLNVALAAKVEELQRYRSDFFGKLRAVLAGRPGVQVVGDRFVFQSEVLFPSGSAEILPAGLDQLHAIAGSLKQIAAEIPAGVSWVLRVDGHADRQPVTRGAFASNWELSSARAIAVVRQLIADGVPADHLAATAFGDLQPVDPGTTPQAFARNRRIELRLTDR